MQLTFWSVVGPLLAIIALLIVVIVLQVRRPKTAQIPPIRLEETEAERIESEVRHNVKIAIQEVKRELNADVENYGEIARIRELANGLLKDPELQLRLTRDGRTVLIATLFRMLMNRQQMISEAEAELVNALAFQRREGSSAQSLAGQFFANPADASVDRIRLQITTLRDELEAIELSLRRQGVDLNGS